MSDERDVLASCPPESRDRWKSTALRVGKSRKAAIRIKCLECCCWQQAEVRAARFGAVHCGDSADRRLRAASRWGRAS